MEKARRARLNNIIVLLHKEWLEFKHQRAPAQQHLRSAAADAGSAGRAVLVLNPLTALVAAMILAVIAGLAIWGVTGCFNAR